MIKAERERERQSTQTWLLSLVPNTEFLNPLEFLGDKKVFPSKEANLGDSFGVGTAH